MSVRVFISSPGDVAEEREKARLVLERMQARYTGRLVLQSVLWEDLPLDAHASFQEGIDLVLSDEYRIDIAVFILWSRLGSPLGSQIRKAGGESYRSGTEREFDLMLRAREQSGGDWPKLLADVRDDDHGFKQKIVAADRQALTEIVNQKEQLDGFIRELFHDSATGTNLRAYHSFSKTADFAGRLKVHLQGLLDEMLGESTAVAWDIIDKGAPYCGLAAFDVEDGPIYFGREQEVCDLQETLRQRAAAGCGLVLLVGASGSGKSSLVRAGLIPALQQFELDDAVATWRHTIMLPGESADDLCVALARALTAPSALAELPDSKVVRLGEYLAKDPAAAIELILADVLDTGSEEGRSAVRLLVMIDQFEELFTHASITESMRLTFVDALVALAGSESIRIVATVRSDFYAECQRLPALMDAIAGGGLVNLLAPRADAIGRMILRPAQLAGLRFEADAASGDSLDRAILNDALEDPEALPLLADLLRELYERRDGQTLTMAAYRELGGVAGALGRRAEDIYIQLPADVRTALSAVLQALVTVRDDDAQATRRRAPLTAVSDTSAKKALADAFVAARLFTADHDSTGQAVISVSHEALLHAWDRAARWIDDNREFLMIRARVDAAARRWDTEGLSVDYLLPAGKPLAEAESLLARRPDLTPLTASYIDSSSAHHQALDVRARRRSRTTLAVVASLALAAFIAAGAAWTQWQSAKETATEAKAAAELARTEATRAQTAEARAEVAVQALIISRNRANKQLGLRMLDRARSYDRSGEPLKAIITGETIVGYTTIGWDRHTSPLIPDMRSPTEHLNRLTQLPEFASAMLATTARSRAHAAAITAVTVSADGALIATGDVAGDIHIWDVKSGRLLHRLSDHTAGILALRFSADGQQLISCGQDGMTRTWSIDLGEALQFIPLDVSSGLRLALGPHGKQMIVASDDLSIRVWPILGGEPIKHNVGLKLASVTDSIADVAFNSDGQQVAAVSREGQLYVWDPAASDMGTPVLFTLRSDQTLSRVALSADHSVAYVGTSKGGVLVHNLETGAQAFGYSGTTSPVTCLIDDAEHGLISGTMEGFVQWHDRETGETTTRQQAHDGPVTDLAYGVDGGHVVSVGWDQTVHLWAPGQAGPLDAMTGAVGAVTTMISHPDGKTFATASEADGRIRIWSSTMTSSTQWRTGKAIKDMSFTKSGDTVIVLHDDGSLNRWNVANAKQLDQIHGLDGNIHCFAVANDRIAIARVDEPSIQIIDLTSGAEIARLTGDPNETFRHLFFSTDGAKLASHSSANRVRVWDIKLDEVLENIGISDAATAIAFNSQVTHVVYGTSKGAIYVNNMSLNISPAYLPGAGTGAVTALALNPAGTVIVAGSAHGTIGAWQVKETFEQVSAYTTPPRARPAGFTQEGHSIDIAPLATMEGHDGRIRALMVADDGGSIYSAADDGSMRAWELPVSDETVDGVTLTGSGQTLGIAHDPLTRRVAIGFRKSKTVELYRLASQSGTPGGDLIDSIVLPIAPERSSFLLMVKSSSVVEMERYVCGICRRSD